MKLFKQLLFPFLFLCLVTAVSMYSLFYTKTTAAQVSAKITPHVFSKKSRAPASTVETKTLHFDCGAKNQNTKINSTVVSIQFINCVDKKIGKDIRIELVNTTNQYVAQIFRVSDRIISTDFIQLAQGENILKFEISLNDKQKKTQIIKIDRISTEIQ